MNVKCPKCKTEMVRLKAYNYECPSCKFKPIIADSIAGLVLICPKCRAYSDFREEGEQIVCTACNYKDYLEKFTTLYCEECGEEAQYIDPESEDLDELGRILCEECRTRDKCASCGEYIVNAENTAMVGEEGTQGYGETVCENCYFQDEPVAWVMYNGDKENPQEISHYKNSTEGEFTVSYHSTDGWRGYYEVETDKYINLFSDTFLSMHSSEQMLADILTELFKELKERNIEFVFTQCRSSNVFSNPFDVWIEKEQKSIEIARIILIRLQTEKDFFNPNHSTGIVFQDGELAKFAKLFPEHNIVSDQDIVDLVKSYTNNGKDIIDELQKRSK